ncbi:MAG: hypothetical protein KC502_23980 [Myxococcales bacterium]|nr:hypothetical protein [Myxococcales bacterium]
MKLIRMMIIGFAAMAAIGCSADKDDDGSSSATDAVATDAAASDAAASDAAAAEDAGSAGDVGAVDPCKDVTETWSSKLTFKQKQQFMNCKVMPTMKPIFAAYPGDSKGNKFEELTCAHCHGPMSEQGTNKFKMPNGIKPMTYENAAKWPGFKGGKAEFMAHKVMAPMVKLLGYKPFDPKTGKGFGCFACHGVKK